MNLLFHQNNRLLGMDFHLCQGVDYSHEDSLEYVLLVSTFQIKHGIFRDTFYCSFFIITFGIQKCKHPLSNISPVNGICILTSVKFCYFHIAELGLKSAEQRLDSYIF